MTFPSGTRGRLLAFWLLTVLLLLSFKLVLWPVWQQHQALISAIEEQRTLLQRHQQLVGQVPLLREKYVLMLDQSRLDDYVVPGDSSAQAAAFIQQRLHEQAQVLNAQILSTRVLPPLQQDGLERVPVSARLQLTLEELRTLLHEFETQSPYLLVHQMSIQPVRTRLSEPSRQVVVQIELHGLRLLPEASHG